MLFVNTTNPELRIYNPASGEFAIFAGGRLEIDESDPNFQVVMDEAKRNPFISIHDKAATCDDCGKQFTGKAAAMDLGKHRKADHFDRWLAAQDEKEAIARDRQIKARAGYVCDVCAPVQEFGTEADLAEHVRLLHTNVELTEGGETIDPDFGAGGAQATTEIPAATPSDDS